LAAQQVNASQQQSIRITQPIYDLRISGQQLRWQLKGHQQQFNVSWTACIRGQQFMPSQTTVLQQVLTQFKQQFCMGNHSSYKGSQSNSSYL